LYKTFREVMLFTEVVVVFGMICSWSLGDVVALLLRVGLCMAYTKYMMSDIKEIAGWVVVIRTQMTRCNVSFSIRPGRNRCYYICKMHGIKPYGLEFEVCCG